MAGVSDCFAIGSIVACKTCYNTVVEGEVQAFDPQTKMLVLKCAASNRRPSQNDVYILNLSLVSDVQVKKEVTTPPEPAKQLNLKRCEKNVDSKKNLVDALRAGVTQEGLMLFNTIEKTISDVTWDGPNIVIWNQVKITPPYKADNIQGDARACGHIRKIVQFTVCSQMSRKSHDGYGRSIVSADGRIICPLGPSGFHLFFSTLSFFLFVITCCPSISSVSERFASDVVKFGITKGMGVVLT
ncbi:unnamed protein product [Nesidiocoris tenuis]|uniref:Uncharacterized protein n=1 Tax=Nesidiocoris tenuis TaxID=355587 RepID=A0A6H5H5U7_9HEMI|nr:unnamed protein product [Nesidiocoris tenuis]